MTQLDAQSKSVSLRNMLMRKRRRSESQLPSTEGAVVPRWRVRHSQMGTLTIEQPHRKSVPTTFKNRNQRIRFRFSTDNLVNDQNREWCGRRIRSKYVLT